MSEIAIPHERVITALQDRLHAAVSDLAMRDAAIAELQERLNAAEASGDRQPDTMGTFVRRESDGHLD